MAMELLIHMIYSGLEITILKMTMYVHVFQGSRIFKEKKKMLRGLLKIKNIFILRSFILCIILF